LELIHNKNRMITIIISILLAILAGFFKANADILDFRFKDSWYNRFKWNQYIDPEVSHLNKDNFKWPWNFIFAPFSDLWHLCYTLMIISLLCIGPFYQIFGFFTNDIVGNWYTCLILAIGYCAGFESTYATLLYFKKEEL
jgi:hypothetical protein